MKMYFILAVALIGLYFLFEKLPSKEALEKESGDGYISKMNETKNQAEKNVNEAVKKEINKINEAIMEPQDLEIVKKYPKAIIKTNLGDIEVKFYGEDSPKTVANFLTLSQNNFFNGTAFHRVIKDFMIQGGDPLSKEKDWSRVGSGGPGYKFADEFNSRKLVRGSLAMANSGPNTNGSQFFIVTAEATSWLDGKHTNFGEVVSGMGVVEKIENSKTIPGDQPVEKIIINSIELLEK